MVSDADQVGVEAALLWCGFDAGYFQVADIESWAERKIAVLNEPPSGLIELATIRRAHPLDIMKLLESLADDIQPRELVEERIGFVGLLFDDGRLSLRAAKEGLWALLREDGMTSDQEAQTHRLYNDFDLALAGVYGNMTTVERELREFVTPYAESLRIKYPRLISQQAQP